MFILLGEKNPRDVWDFYVQDVLESTGMTSERVYKAE
jgi:hypothetical protein